MRRRHSIQEGQPTFAAAPEQVKPMRSPLVAQQSKSLARNDLRVLARKRKPTVPTRSGFDFFRILVENEPKLLGFLHPTFPILSLLLQTIFRKNRASRKS